jgi:hypothetical protein
MSGHIFRKIVHAQSIQLDYIPAGVTLTADPIQPEQTVVFRLSEDSALGDLEQALFKEWEYVGPEVI